MLTHLIDPQHICGEGYPSTKGFPRYYWLIIALGCGDLGAWLWLCMVDDVISSLEGCLVYMMLIILIIGIFTMVHAYHHGIFLFGT